MTPKFNTFAIGDVHGRADLLSATLKEIANVAARPYRVVFIGDIIDRGPHSRVCLDLVKAELVREPRSVLLRGNHEELMLRFVVKGAEKQTAWLANGGMEALASYGYDPADSLVKDDEGRFTVNAEFSRRFEAEQTDHLEMLRRSVNYIEIDNHIFVHAGIDPLLPLDEQDPYEMRWTKRTPDHRPLGTKTVVHGHVPTETGMPELYDNRIVIDTGAYYTGRLTTMLLRPDGSDAEFYCTDPNSHGHACFHRVDAVFHRVDAVDYRISSTAITCKREPAPSDRDGRDLDPRKVKAMA